MSTASFDRERHRVRRADRTAKRGFAVPRSSRSLRRTGRPADLAAALAAIGFGSLAFFQAALAAGAPWGHAAWGGGNAHLSAGQRAASAVAAAVYVVATLIVLCRAGIIWPARSNATLVKWGTWFFAVVMAIGAVPNFASQSRWENFIFGPLALVLAALCIVVARATTTDPARGRTGAAELRGR
jgi:hypothetical protein